MEKHKKLSQKKKKIKISGPTWNKKIELPDGSYSVSYFRNCFKYIIKNMKQ